MRRAKEANAVFYGIRTTADNGLHRGCSTPYRSVIHIKICRIYISCPEFAIRARFPMICIVFKRRRGVPGTFRSVADIVRRTGETHAVVYRGPAAAEDGVYRSRSAPGRGSAVVDIIYGRVYVTDANRAVRARLPTIRVVFQRCRHTPRGSRAVVDIIYGRVDVTRAHLAIRVRLPTIRVVFQCGRRIPGSLRSVADVVRRAGEAHAVVYRGPAAAEDGLRERRCAPEIGRAHV